MYCRWFVKCENQAIGLAAHPVFTAVPICYRCAMRLGIYIPLPHCRVCGADLPQEVIDSLAYEGDEICSDDCLLVDFMVNSKDTSPEADRMIERIMLSNGYETRY